MQSYQVRLVKNNASCICTFYNNGKANVMVIDSVFVDEDFRRKGFGKNIIKQAIALGKAQDVDCIELVVNKDNTIAKNLYEKLKF